MPVMVNDEELYTYREVANETGLSIEYIRHCAANSMERAPDCSIYKRMVGGNPYLTAEAIDTLKREN